MRLRGSAVSAPEVQISMDAILVAEASPHAKKPKSRDGEEAGADDGCRQRSSVEDQDLSRTQVVEEMALVLVGELSICHARTLPGFSFEPFSCRTERKQTHTIHGPREEQTARMKFYHNRLDETWGTVSRLVASERRHLLMVWKLARCSDPHLLLINRSHSAI